MSAQFTSRLGEFRERHSFATDKALVAAAGVLRKAAMEKHRRGYTSGRFSFGQVRNSITVSEPVTEDGVRVIRAGIRGGILPKNRQPGDPATIGQISLFWELGHNNAWTRRYERVEKWRPAVLESREAMVTMFARVYEALMQRGPQS